MSGRDGAAKFRPATEPERLSGDRNAGGRLNCRVERRNAARNSITAARSSGTELAASLICNPPQIEPLRSRANNPGKKAGSFYRPRQFGGDVCERFLV